MSPRLRWAVGLALLVSGVATARSLPNYHEVFTPRSGVSSASGLKAVNSRLSRKVSASASESRFGLPTVLRAPYTANGALPAAKTPVDAAREHLRANAGAYFLRASEVDGAVLKHVHDTGRGAIIVKFVSRPGGIEVWGEELNVVMDRRLRLVGMTGYLSTPDSAASLFAGASGFTTRAKVASFAIDHSSAVAAAYGDLTGTPLGAGAFQENGVVRGDYHGVTLRAGVSTPSPLSFPGRARQVLFHEPGKLVPAYYVEVASPDPLARSLDYYSYVISARDGKVLVRTNLSQRATAFTYRVWADSGGSHQPMISPVGNGETPAPGTAPQPGYVLPAAVARNDVSVTTGPISTGDPWLADGATETIGNNVHAYTDLGAEDGLQPDPGGPDYTANTSSANAFQYDWSDANGANTSVPQNKAAITQLFYMVNWLHDWYYDNGFDEAAGNAQMNNYGRGPAAGDQDPIFAETNDFSGTDNANMWTPADGSPPRMQMYVFDGPSDQSSLTTTPAHTFPAGSVQPMAQGARNFDVTADVVKAAPAAACSPLTNAAQVAGKIVLIARGGDNGGAACSFEQKQINAIAAGAAGILIWNKTNGAFGPGFGTGAVTAVGNLFIDNANGQALDTAVGAGTVTAHMSRAAKDLDGALDMGIVAHEWGHYIQHRLIAAGAQDSQQGAGMGEGWSDFHALLFMVREGQDTGSNANWMGAYGVGNYASLTFNDDERWFGIRRATYSADPAKNHTTFKFIGQAIDGSTLPFPFLGTTADNPAEVHATGEIWAAMLFDCYVSMLQNHPFAEAQNTMKDYIVASYKVTPAFPTFVEARDALLQVVAANSLEDYDRFGHAFANRGLGIGAVAPDRGDPNNSGVVESFDWGDNFRIESVTVGDGSINCDGDGILDPAETGTVSVTVRNIGQHTLTGVTATASSTTADISFDGPNPKTFADIAPGALGTVTIGIHLDQNSTVSSYQLSVAVHGTVGTGGTATQNQTFNAVVANLDETPGAATDTFSTLSSNWSIMVAPHTMQPPPGTVWTFVNNGQGNSDDGTSFQGFTNVQADESIVTPPIDVAATGDFTLAFQNLYVNFIPGGLSADLTGGVVVEVSDDGGATWTDMKDVTGVAITNGYSDRVPTPSAGVTPNERNPLAGREAFTGANPALLGGGGFDNVSVNFHGAYAGKTVLIRFRYGYGWTDFGPQWLYELDTVALTGISNHPFLTDVADRGLCKPIANAGPDQTVPERTQATLHGTAPDLQVEVATQHWTQTEGPAVTLSDATSLSPTFTAPDVPADTRLTFRLDATGQNGTSSSVTHVLVQDVNRPPVAAITANDSVQTGGSLSLSGTGSSDPDGDAITYQWSQTSGPAGSFTGGTTSATTTFVAGSTGGNVTIGLTVTDAKGLSNTASKTVTVNAPAKDEGGCNSTGTPASALAALLVGVFFLARRRRTV